MKQADRTDKRMTMGAMPPPVQLGGEVRRARSAGAGSRAGFGGPRGGGFG
jgi:hypothetical protein